MGEEVFQKSKISEPVSIVAHQLKNPISVLKGYLEALISGEIGKINKKQKEYLYDALENVERMSTIVNHLLDVSKIEEKRYEVKKTPINLSALAKDVVEEFSSWAKAINCEVVFNPPADLLLVQADLIKIRQVIENLISNAVKYKSQGQAKVEIRIQKKGNKVLFSCKDNGIGVPDKDLKKVFSKFYRSEDALDIDPAGTGLGLYINKAIIELSGGKIWFKKNKEKGMTFYFTLPIIPSP